VHNNTFNTASSYCTNYQVHIIYIYIRLTAFCQNNLGKPAPERQTILDLLEQEMMEWQWHQLDHMQIICSRQITMPVPHHSVFTGRMPFLLPNQQRQSVEGTTK